MTDFFAYVAEFAKVCQQASPGDWVRFRPGEKDLGEEAAETLCDFICASPGWRARARKMSATSWDVWCQFSPFVEGSLADQALRKPLESQEHLACVAPRDNGYWGVYCLACSDAAGDYVFPCKVRPESPYWPPAILRAEE